MPEKERARETRGGRSVNLLLSGASEKGLQPRTKLGQHDLSPWTLSTWSITPCRIGIGSTVNQQGVSAMSRERSDRSESRRDFR